jgi:NADH-quinone oxidoreductase chain I
MANPVSRGLFSEAMALAGAVIRAMRITAMNLFRKPVTVHYPEKPRTYPDRYRGLLALTYDKTTGEENCIGCRLCEYICPPAVIKVEMLKGQGRNFAKSFSLEMYACEFCELCVQVCPTDAIVMTKSFDLATTDRRELLLDKDRLHVLGLKHEVSWGIGTRLRDMQNPPPPKRPAAPPPPPKPEGDPA